MKHMAQKKAAHIKFVLKFLDFIHPLLFVTKYHIILFLNLFSALEFS